MQVPAWQISNWDSVCVPVSEWNASIVELRHLGTTAHIEENKDGLRHGQVVWGIVASSNKLVGIAWDWREIKVGIVALSDPMTILSNLVFVDGFGQPVDAFKRILYLNNAVFSLPWQSTVCASNDEMLEGRRA